MHSFIHRWEIQAWLDCGLHLIIPSDLKISAFVSFAFSVVPSFPGSAWSFRAPLGFPYHRSKPQRKTEFLCPIA